MAYYLGIDLGTTYTAAAAEREGVVEALTLGNRTASVPSVVFLRDDGEILVGEAATRRATSDPGRVAREFKRRIGDPTPIILGGTPYAAEMLMARLLRWSVDRVREQQGEPPQAIALTHPANWGPYKLDLFSQAVRQVDLDAALMLAEPVAAATFYASQRRLAPGSVVAVYDLGGGTFDAAMVRRTANGFETIGTPEGIERLGGIDFDEAVFAHVRNAVGDGLDRLDPEEPAAQAAVARLRQECIDAKEALSSDTDVSIPVLLPGLQTEVRLTRSEFEAMIRPAISETIVALRRAIRSAGVKPDDIGAVLLVGGSSRIPLVAQMVGAELGRPIAIDAHPKDAIAFGAAIAVAERRGAATPESVTTVLPDDTRPPPPTISSDAARVRAARPAPPRPAAAGAAGAAAGAPVGAAASRPPAGAAASRPPAGAAASRPPAPGSPPARPAPPAGVPASGRPGAFAPPPSPAGPHPLAPAAHPTPAAPADARTGGVASRPVPPPAGRPAPPSAGTPTGPSTVPGPARPAAPSGPAHPAAPPGPAAPGPASGGRPAPTTTTGYHTLSGPSGPAAPARPPGAAPAQPTPSPYSGTPRAGGAAVGGQNSGGFPTAPGTRGPAAADNRTLWIALGVIAAVALIVILVVTLSGGGDESGSGSTGSGSGSGSTDSGYTPAVEQEFMDSCVPAGGEPACECAYGEIVETIPFDRFSEIDAALEADPSAQFEELNAIITACAAEA
jgi:molecular chaperone DnaK